MRFIFIIALFAMACTGKRIDNSKIIPRQEMIKILWDIMLVDEFAVDFIHRDTAKDVEKERKILYLQVFDLHNVSREQFSSSFKFYSAHPQDMKMIFDSLNARGARERKNVYLPKDSQPK
ncbi:MAG: DUF4296 domain-containing protein [Chitinophagaceae bacterium]